MTSRTSLRSLGAAAAPAAATAVAAATAAIIMLCTPWNLAAQETSSDWAWKDVVVQDSVAIQYIFYARPGGSRDGVVLKLVNRNRHPVDYTFTVIFRSGDEHVREQVVDGRIEARTLVTGEDAGLFFEPFEEGVSVGMIGIRALRIRPSFE